jgi:hypothetical protein
MRKRFNGLASLDRTRGSLGSTIAGFFIRWQWCRSTASGVLAQRPKQLTTGLQPAPALPFGVEVNLNAMQSKSWRQLQPCCIGAKSQPFGT